MGPFDRDSDATIHYTVYSIPGRTIDITGWSFTFAVYDGSKQMFTYSSSDIAKIALAAPTNGTVDVYVAVSDVSPLLVAPKQYTYKFIGINLSSKQYALDKGPFFIV